MEMRYRGYPQELYAAGLRLMAEQADLSAGYRREGRRTLPTPGKKRKQKNEADYFKGLYPAAVRKRQLLVEEAVDRLDFAGSPLYDEYPDRETLYRLCGRIVDREREMGLPEERELSFLLLISELYRRRTVTRE